MPWMISLLIQAVGLMEVLLFAIKGGEDSASVFVAMDTFGALRNNQGMA